MSVIGHPADATANRFRRGAVARAPSSFIYRCRAAPPSRPRPPGFDVREGLNRIFPVDGVMRAFIVIPARGASGPRPYGCR